MKTYQVTEIFYSLQGEGVRAGTPNVFVRFAGCNLTCQQATHGFDCDTNFSGGRALTAEALLAEMEAVGGPSLNVILTGGEPLLQVDEALLVALWERHWRVALETNGSHALPELLVKEAIWWITVSPKVAEHALRIQTANEVKYVLAHGMALPKPRIEAEHYLVSPAVQPEGHITREDLAWCIQLVKANPRWRLSCQQHKAWGIR